MISIKKIFAVFFVLGVSALQARAVTNETEEIRKKTLSDTYGENSIPLFEKYCTSSIYAAGNYIDCGTKKITCGSNIDTNLWDDNDTGLSDYCAKEEKTNSSENDNSKVSALYAQRKAECISIKDATWDDKKNECNKPGDNAKKIAAGVSTAAMGIGGMQLAQGLAEQSADKATAQEVSAYLSNLRCGISNGLHDVKVGTESTLPTFSPEFAKLRQEYIGIDSKSGLVGKLKSAKENLGIAPGIESELIMDTSGLYKNNSVGTGSGQFETAEERLGDDKSRIKTGAIIAGAGAVVGIAAPVVIDKVVQAKQENKTEKEPVKTNDAAQE